MMGVPTLVAPINWTRLGWRTLEAMSLEKKSLVFSEMMIPWRDLAATLRPQKRATLTLPYDPLPKTSCVEITSSLSTTQWGWSWWERSCSNCCSISCRACSVCWSPCRRLRLLCWYRSLTCLVSCISSWDCCSCCCSCWISSWSCCTCWWKRSLVSFNSSWRD